MEEDLFIIQKLDKLREKMEHEENLFIKSIILSVIYRIENRRELRG